MAAKIRKGDLVEVVRGRTSDEAKLAERNARREAEGLEPLKPGDKGRQGRVIKVFPREEKVLVEGINLKTRHVRQGAQGQAGGIETIEAPISLSKIALVDPDTKKRVRVGFREDTIERDGRVRTVRVRVTRGGAKRGIEQGKEI
ncbi:MULTISPECIES: 50S ribosomal protein L24 [unclassified Schaalia]|uniref:50S ribosomal protein L24 n=1 Tax=unclassified Schaalia TaxID=2691889 RepID=UPI001E3ED96A|nr:MULTISPECIES: 50S ribosomal protein L24 [unclassified Schaalia]MCD4549846.1 50S ribosomal protein L24 [Schaalia sp. lx-260]MCD4556862.1 50S ribosomal protein L24 [Schaalia sp. lx-100]